MSKKIPGGKGNKGRKESTGGGAGKSPGHGIISLFLPNVGIIEHEKNNAKPVQKTGNRSRPGRGRGNGKGGGK